MNVSCTGHLSQQAVALLRSTVTQTALSHDAIREGAIKYRASNLAETMAVAREKARTMTNSATLKRKSDVR